MKYHSLRGAVSYCSSMHVVRYSAQYAENRKKKSFLIPLAFLAIQMIQENQFKLHANSS